MLIMNRIIHLCIPYMSEEQSSPLAERSKSPEYHLEDESRSLEDALIKAGVAESTLTALDDVALEALRVKLEAEPRKSLGLLKGQESWVQELRKAVDREQAKRRK